MLFTVGKITKPHGLKGVLKVYLFEKEREKIFNGSRYFIEEKEYEVEDFGTIGSNFTVKFKNIDDRTSAESLSGKLLQIEENDLLELNENEYHAHDIIGSTIYDADGIKVGKVKDVIFLNTGDVLDIISEEGKLLTLLFKKDFFTTIDVAEKKLVLSKNKEFYAF